MIETITMWDGRTQTHTLEPADTFAARVLAHTGVELHEMPDLPADAHLVPGPIVARRGGTVVYAITDYPIGDGEPEVLGYVVDGRTRDLPPYIRKSTYIHDDPGPTCAGGSPVPRSTAPAVDGGVSCRSAEEDMLSEIQAQQGHVVARAPRGGTLVGRGPDGGWAWVWVVGEDEPRLLGRVVQVRVADLSWVTPQRNRYPSDDAWRAHCWGVSA